MIKRSIQQKIGARGHRWLMSLIEEHPSWLVRELGEDYGIDMEAELTDDGVKGELLKIQVKSSVRLRRRDAFVEGIIEKRYVEYAIACRYPVILVFIDIEAKEARYIWLQDWILRKQAEGTLSETQDSWVQWIDENAALVSGLNSELKNIARWRGKTQLVLSLLDALRSAVSIQDEKIVKQLVEIFSTNTKDAATHSLDAIVREAALLGNRLYGTREGNAMAATLYELARRFGGKISKRTIYDLVIRGESASRIGINTLGILYDDFFDHISSLGLPEYFRSTEPRVAYYCALRETISNVKSSVVRQADCIL